MGPGLTGLLAGGLHAALQQSGLEGTDPLNYPRRELFKLLGAESGTGKELVSNLFGWPTTTTVPAQGPPGYLPGTQGVSAGDGTYAERIGMPQEEVPADNPWATALGGLADIFLDPVNLALMGAPKIAQLGNSLLKGSAVAKAPEIIRMGEEAAALAPSYQRALGFSAQRAAPTATPALTAMSQESRLPQIQDRLRQMIAESEAGAFELPEFMPAAASQTQLMPRSNALMEALDQYQGPAMEHSLGQLRGNKLIMKPNLGRY